MHWLIEGKSDHDVARRDVEAKRAAAEEWATFVNDDGRFGTWRYLFCSETAIKNAHGVGTACSWLLARTRRRRSTRCARLDELRSEAGLIG